jgi:hypothetical protein
LNDSNATQPMSAADAPPQDQALSRTEQAETNNHKSENLNPIESGAAQQPAAAATATTEDGDTDGPDPCAAGGAPKAKKRKVAIFLAYDGRGYQGMQRNPGAKTIEEELFKAIHAAGGISDANADDRGFTKERSCFSSFHILHLG